MRYQLEMCVSEMQGEKIMLALTLDECEHLLWLVRLDSFHPSYRISKSYQQRSDTLKARFEVECQQIEQGMKEAR